MIPARLRWPLLADAHPWPAERPRVAEQWHGWFHAKTRALLAEHVTRDTGLVLELGTWLGLSTRWILRRAPRAKVISIDHGQAGMARLPAALRKDVAAKLPTLDATVRRNLWPWRRRLVLVTADTLAGISQVYSCALTPEVCYIDAGHDYEHVSRELRLLDRLWPGIPLVGDDFSWAGVRRAVEQFAEASARPLTENGVGWAVGARARG